MREGHKKAALWKMRSHFKVTFEFLNDNSCEKHWHIQACLVTRAREVEVVSSPLSLFCGGTQQKETKSTRQEFPTHPPFYGESCSWPAAGTTFLWFFVKKEETKSVENFEMRKLFLEKKPPLVCCHYTVYLHCFLKEEAQNVLSFRSYVEHSTTMLPTVIQHSRHCQQLWSQVGL